MSFVKNAVKKVFSFVKRLVKNKIFQAVALIALTVFTAGVAVGGFAAFSGVSSVGGFFTAVGQTMATGAAKIASLVGMKSTAASLASKGGAAAIKAGLVTTSETAAAIASSAAAKAAAAGSANYAAAQGAVASTAGGMAGSLPAAGTVAAEAAAAGGGGAVASEASGWWGATKSVMGKKVLGNVTVGQMATSFVTNGLNNYMKRDKHAGKVYVAGDWAFGGGTDPGTDGTWAHRKAQSKGLSSGEAESQRAAAKAPTDTRMDTPSVANQYAQQGGLVGTQQQPQDGQPAPIGQGFNNVNLNKQEDRMSAREQLAQQSPIGAEVDPQGMQVQQQNPNGLVTDDQFDFTPTRINYQPQRGLV